MRKRTESAMSMDLPVAPPLARESSSRNCGNEY